MISARYLEHPFENNKGKDKAISMTITRTISISTFYIDFELIMNFKNLVFFVLFKTLITFCIQAFSFTDLGILVSFRSFGTIKALF